MSNIQSAVESLENQIPTNGIQYTAASDLPCSLDEKAAKAQVDHFLKTNEWVSYCPTSIGTP